MFTTITFRLTNFRRAGFGPLSFHLVSRLALKKALDCFRLLQLSLLSLALVFVSGCSGCGSSGGGGSSGGADNGSEEELTCTGNQILNAEQDACVDCPEDHAPNSDHTSCLPSCEDGEIKPDNKPTCEMIVTCTEEQVHNPATNTCIAKQCADGEVADTTEDPPVCISASACREADGKFVNTTGDSCISLSACISVNSHVAATSGNCQTCAGDRPIHNMERTQCLSISDCQSQSDNAFSVLNGECITDAACTATPGRVATTSGACETCTGDRPIHNMEKTQCLSISDCQSQSAGAFSVLNGECITDAACTATPGRVATSDGVCETCTGANAIRNMEKTQCLSISDCQSQSAGAFSVLNGECITDAACTATPGRVATNGGLCHTCAGNTPVRNMEKTQCLSESACQTQSDNAFSVLGGECITDAACRDMPGHVATSAGICEACMDPTPLVNAAKDACESDSDSDGDGLSDGNDNCPMGVMGAATTGDASLATADPDGDGCKNSEDVDDDNDGLIEIATAQELDNMRHNFAGTSYDDEAADTDPGDTGDTTGGPHQPHRVLRDSNE